MKDLLKNIRSCTICKDVLVNGVNPVLAASVNSRIAIIGQAPGSVVHKSGVPWDDKSGKRLREWMGVTNEQFYDAEIFAIIPTGFCYPGKGKSGDLAPRKECAPLWHKLLLSKMEKVKLILLVGKYAQDYYLKQDAEKSLTETVRNYKNYLPNYLVLPHPSPRNNIWQAKNSWFKSEVLPELQLMINDILK